MSKKSTTIIAESGMDLKDKSNLESFAEKTLKNLNVDLNSVKFDNLKPIVKEWYPKIIETIIKLTDDSVDFNFSSENNLFTIFFSDKNKCEEFRVNFMKNVHKGLNKFLLDKGENVKHYNRILVFETKQEDLLLQIQF